jgi:RNA polymerase sigma-32 factor
MQIWWIRAAIQAYVLHNWSMVRIGTNGARKKLFFNLARLRHRMQAAPFSPLAAEHVRQIADLLSVPERDVVKMDQRLAGQDISLNAPAGTDGQDERQTRLVDDGDDPEIIVAKNHETAKRQARLASALDHLNGRERHIITMRRLNENPGSLVDPARHYGVSKERVHQLEARALTKLRFSVGT